MRTPDGMEPTSLALVLAPVIRNALVEIDNAFGAEHVFDPKTSKSTFQLGIGSNIISMLILSELMKRMLREAPLMDLRLVHSLDPVDSLRANNAHVDLDTGRIDLLIMREWDLPERFASEKFFGTDFVCVARSGNRKFQPRMAKEVFTSFDHVMVTLGNADAGFLTNALAASGMRRNVKVRVPLYSDAVKLVAETDLVVLLPRALLPSALKGYRFKVLELPIESPILKFEFVWHVSRNADPAILWLRNKVRECYEHVIASLDIPKPRG